MPWCMFAGHFFEMVTSHVYIGNVKIDIRVANIGRPRPLLAPRLISLSYYPTGSIKFR